MYIHRLKLNLREVHVLRDISDPCNMKSTLSRICDQGEFGRILHRLDCGHTDVILWVQTAATKPVDWSAVLLPGYASEVAGKPFSPQLRAGQVLGFDLRGTPTEKVKGKIVSLPEDRYTDWLLGKATASGFELLDVNGSRGSDLRGQRKVIGGAVVDFSGVLEVTVPQALVSALESGIGRNKAWGCGMLRLMTRRV